MSTDIRRACRGADTEEWFRDREIGSEAVAATERAKGVCARCVVRVECLSTALIEEEGTGRDYRFGVRGGLTGLDRAYLVERGKRQKGRAA
ncbi:MULTISPECIES: WhiB family transcriptional regulator [unclassified Streptomyces]|uniref:WhiB family transcriptional regulator n=1 Tax=unclassified Streptomyces TaxID=2593676 RepID=UPI00081E3070|nr:MULTISPECIES: WhiB family transcriptional regulator [unclassified Streptomyces]MYR93060.1 WhiB family transcriptional regulator [Streptomyces sp. SID4937]SCD45782.1 Transcription factor WhiB [Streptomyces sp. ScaeMP-e83]